MKMNLARAAVVTLAMGWIGTAHAVPIYFDFTGSVIQESPSIGIGTAVSGGFTLETDRLAFLPSSPNQYIFADFAAPGLTEPLAFIDFAGIHQEIPDRPISFATVAFVDACTPVCTPGVAEGIHVTAATQDPWSAGYTGQMRRVDMSVNNIYWNRLPDYPFYDLYNGFDGTTAAPIDVVSMAFGELSGTFFEPEFDCVAGECTVTREEYFVFSIDTLSRGVGTRAVPEPGTLGLMGAAVFLGFTMRRRRTVKAG